MNISAGCTSTKRSILIAISLCFFFALVFSPNSFAFELTDTVDLVQGNHVMVFDYYNCSSSPTCINGQYVRSQNYQYTAFENTTSDLNAVLNQFTVSIPNRQYAPSDYVSMDFYIMNSYTSDSGDYFARSFAWAGASGWDLVDVNYSTIGPSTGKITLTIKCYTAGTYGGATFSGSSYGNIALKPGEIFTTGLATVWRPRTGTNYSGSFQNVINAINSQPNYTQNLNNIRNDIQGLQDAQEQANQDANDRYEDEKQTINDNADNAESEASGFSPSFIIPNPLSSVFNGVSDVDCFNFNYLPSWLHLNETRICTPWPSQVRQFLTVVVNVLVGCIIFEFVVKVFKRNDTGGD